MKPEDLSPYERFQLEKYGNILPELDFISFANGEKSEEELRFSEWMQHEAEQQMLRDEEYYSSIKD